MGTRSPGKPQRDRGQLGGVSGAAGTLARLGEATLTLLLVLASVAPAAASKTSRNPSVDPAPQKAPVVARSGSPAPDPAPQAAPNPEPSHPTTRSGTSLSAATVSAPVAPRVVHVTAPAEPSASTGVTVSSNSIRGGSHHAAAPASHHPKRISHAAPRRVAPRHPPPVKRDAAHPISLSLLLNFLPTHLFQLPALHPGADSGRDGVLLLLSAVAMGVLAVASFTLLRRLKRLTGEPR